MPIETIQTSQNINQLVTSYTGRKGEAGYDVRVIFDEISKLTKRLLMFKSKHVNLIHTGLHYIQRNIE